MDDFLQICFRPSVIVFWLATGLVFGIGLGLVGFDVIERGDAAWGMVWTVLKGCAVFFAAFGSTCGLVILSGMALREGGADRASNGSREEAGASRPVEGFESPV